MTDIAVLARRAGGIVILLCAALVVLAIVLLLETRWGHWSPERWAMLLVAGFAALLRRLRRE